MYSFPTRAFASPDVYLNPIQWERWHWSDGSTPGTNITYFFRSSGQKPVGASDGKDEVAAATGRGTTPTRTPNGSAPVGSDTSERRPDDAEDQSQAGGALSS